MGDVVWVEIAAEWAYWIDPESFNLKRVKKRAPVGAVIIVKSRERIDDERTYVDSSFGLITEIGIAEFSKKEAREILSRQFIELTRWKKQWPPHTSIKKTLSSGDVEINYEPTEYDSFKLLVTHQMIDSDPSEYLKRLKKHEAPQTPLWKVETAKSGRSRCRSCNDVILEGRFRIGEPYFYEGNLSYKWYHPRCLVSSLDMDEIGNLDGYKALRPEEKLRLKRIFTR
ncbi:MAG: PARP-type zinc finger-containing protein [Promethearchaeota archaeon]